VNDCSPCTGRPPRPSSRSTTVSRLLRPPSRCRLPSRGGRRCLSRSTPRLPSSRCADRELAGPSRSPLQPRSRSPGSRMRPHRGGRMVDRRPCRPWCPPRSSSLRPRLEPGRTTDEAGTLRTHARGRPPAEVPPAPARPRPADPERPRAASTVAAGAVARRSRATILTIGTRAPGTTGPTTTTGRGTTDPRGRVRPTRAGTEPG